MATATELDRDTTQLVFRASLDALAEPGELRELPEAGLPAALLPLLSLADLDTPVFTDTEHDAVRTATGSPLVPPERARLAAVLGDTVPLHRFPAGSAAAPERAALITLAVAGFSAGTALQLTGPGVPGSRELRVRGLPDDFTAQRAALSGFPAGPDLLLVAPDGRLAGLPRSTRVEGAS
ncbi:phosphonate C-P lyase system protein PhnH [Saccharopolyspora sp. HNM0983]|uniref:Phosphonate C-P lyase system protein PhnH n=1 Tax=Saccharopolyspora montiporae TaxID=2781240 RepID=A0A929G263_9PSEU|nr:phosphonate C-P lyase system protein PhnH [Saccharopolyspora sp. HNM0983]MBE9376537.1 phosphonate C-P lyase system protein PhnH [Saccharopolyspora sp. HNM0983]